jgi:hypothetical protein
MGMNALKVAPPGRATRQRREKEIMERPGGKKMWGKKFDLGGA